MLRFSLLYNNFQNLLDGGLRKKFVNEFVVPSANDTILDLGCGTGNLYPYIKNKCSTYIGVDWNQRYINYAIKKYNCNDFICQDVDNINITSSFNKIVCSSLLHHLSDKAYTKMLFKSISLLKDHGEFISIDPLFHDNQTILSYIFCKFDRGNYIRNNENYIKLFKQVFNNIDYSYLGKVSIVPTHFCVYKCSL